MDTTMVFLLKAGFTLQKELANDPERLRRLIAAVKDDDALEELGGIHLSGKRPKPKRR
jgi:hypothetical protein